MAMDCTDNTARQQIQALQDSLTIWTTTGRPSQLSLDAWLNKVVLAVCHLELKSTVPPANRTFCKGPGDTGTQPPPPPVWK